MFWARGPHPGNVGDLIGPYLYEKDTGKKPVYERKGNPSLITCGSTIRFAGPDTTVWGAGHIQQGDHSDPRASYVAVRGPLTREMVLADGGTCPELYGDPASCLPFVYTPKIPRDRRPALVPHYVDLGIARERIPDIDMKVVSPLTDDVEGFIDEVAYAPFVISSSLHGCLIPLAYGVPVCWAEFSDGVIGSGFKFRDALGPNHVPIDCRETWGVGMKRDATYIFSTGRSVLDLWEARPWRSV